MRAAGRIVVITALTLSLSACEGAPAPFLAEPGAPAPEDIRGDTDPFMADDGVPGDDGEDGVPGEDGVRAPLPALATCGAGPLWATATDIYEIVYGSPELTVAPGGALAARAGGGPLAFYRMSDGDALGAEWGNWDETLDASWERRMVQVQQGDEAAWVEIRDARTGEVLHTQPAAPSPSPDLTWLRLLRGFITPDGTRLATMTCWSRIPSDVSTARVQVHGLDTGVAGPMIDLDVDCGDNLWPRAAPAVLSDDGRRLILTFMAQPEVFVVDLEAGTVAVFDPVGDLPDGVPVNENWGYGNTAILDIALRPDGDAMALSDRTGRITRWSLPGLTSLGEPWDAGLVGINQYTYGPSLESPVSWSPDGALLAHLDGDGEAVVRRAGDGEVLLTLPRPELTPPDWTGEALFNPATAFRFSADGAGVLVAFELGLALWRCPGSPPVTAPGALGPVTIEGPTSAALYDTQTWTVSCGSDGQPVVFRLLLDDVPVAGGLHGLLAASLSSPGAHTLQAIADDGVSQAASPVVEIFVE
jgi:hypothetical protein